MNGMVRKFSVALLAFVSAGASAQNVDMQTLVSGMKHGGYVVVFRHGATHRDQADTDPLNLDNVAKQRQLSDSGREVAKQVGGHTLDDAFVLLQERDER